MKLHLPVLLRKALLACFAFTFTCAVSSAADLTLGSEDSLTIDYAAAETIPDLEKSVLQLSGDTILLLSNCGEGDGKTYTLLTGISDLLDAEGNPLTLTDENNAIASYFDTTQPGTGFWAESTLVLTPDGSLQLVRHNETVKDAKDITTRQTSTLVYNYYEGISFKDIEYTVSDSYAFGGAIYGGSSSTITLCDNGEVSFSGNTASYYGGAIYGSTSSTIELSNNGEVSFSGNTASYSGGAIHGYGDITLSNNVEVSFSGNTASTGGAIDGYGDITLCDNGEVSFSGNTASYYGGAIYGFPSSTIELSNNGTVTFSGNAASYRGGAIYGYTITLNDNGSVTFSENSASGSDAYGGAIYGSTSSTIELSNNDSVTFSGNAASYGGAIYVDDGSTITLSDNGTVTFSGNSASTGGAIGGYGDITLSNNGEVSFSGNTASYSGGAIHGYGDITLSGNGSVEFSGNTATGSDYTSGGAIYGYNSTIELSNNGTVTFSGNAASYGGAIFGSSSSTIELSNNGTVTFSGNEASYGGGAIYTDRNLTIRNNDSVLFEKNAAVTNGVYTLRSIYSWLGSAEISLSAAAGKSIEFRDSVYIGSADTVELNADYTDAAGVVHKQMGDIIFTGKYTEQHLNELLATDDAGRTANAEEILASRTTEVNPTANLFNGRLIIKEGAIWSGSGITVDPVAGATGKPTLLLQNGILTHGASSATDHNVVTIKSGGAFEVAGKSQADYTSLNMESGSILTFNIAPENASTAALTLDSNSSLTQEGALTLKLKGDNRLVKGQSYKLLTGLAQPDTWDETSVTVESGSLGWDVDYTDLTWEGDTLWIYYDGNILPPVEFRPNLDRNQQAVYDTTKDIVDGGDPGGVLGLLGKEIVNSRDEAALKRALDELSGREYATIMSSQMEGNLGHLRRLRAAAGAGTPLGEYVSVSYCYPSNKGVDKSDNKGASVQIAPSPEVDSRRLRAGISVFHEEGELDSDNNGDGYDRSETGAQLTMEYMVSNEFIMGMGISQSRTRLTPDYGKTRHEDNTHFDLYGVYRSGRWSSTTALGVGLHQHDLGRTVAGMQTDAEADGFSVNFLQEVAYTVWADEQQGLQVFGAVESSFNKVDSFTETGAGNASLSMDGQEAWATDVTLGLRYNHALPALDKALPGTLSLHAGVVASLGDVEESATMRFAGAPGYSFRQEAAERNRWGYSVGVSVNLPVSANVAAFGSAEAVLRGDSYTADAQLGLKVAF